MTVDGRLQFVVRALQSPSWLDGAFRVHVSPDDLLSAGLDGGEVCEITDGKDGATLLGYGIAWRATDRMGASPKMRPVKMTDLLRNAFGIAEGSQVNLIPTDKKITKADKIVLTDVTPRDYLTKNKGEIEDDKWWIRSAYTLMNCEAFASGHTFDVSTKKGNKKRFHIERVEAAGTKRDSPNLFYSNDHTKILFADSTESRPAAAANGDSEIALTTKHIGGLLEQLRELNDRLKRVLNQSRAGKRASNRCILIHGYEGTGKSLLLSRLEHAGFRRTFRLDKSGLTAGKIAENHATIRSMFANALENQPSLIMMDDIAKIAPSTDDVHGNTIIEELDKLIGSHVAVVATCRTPSDINGGLVGPGRLSSLIEFEIPDLPARQSILSILLDKNEDRDGTIIKNIGLRTHGFTGKDLAWLVEIACSNMDSRYEQQTDHSVGRSSPNNSWDKLLEGAAHAQAAVLIENQKATLSEELDADELFEELTMEDFDFALTKIRPTALREIFFEKPQIQWSDIGGSQGIKERFNEIISWPLHASESMANLRMHPKKGVLLYGPPGCSKTLTAQAVATNYDLNFIAIKGAELVSMYVGESERSVREIFRKARTAAPCVIFFDEIDSIASERENAGTKGLNVVTTLLNEMDGFRSLRGVLVLAATNKPGVLDPAIMRPGRFDSHIYLGLPGEVARKEIFALETDGILKQHELDLDRLASAAEGYSGAEIVNICQVAKEQALRRYMTEGTELCGVSMADFEYGIETTRRGVTDAMLMRYQAFAKKDRV